MKKYARRSWGPLQKEQLRRMIGFRFKRHPILNLPERHLQAIEKLLEARVRELLAMPKPHFIRGNVPIDLEPTAA